MQEKAGDTHQAEEWQGLEKALSLLIPSVVLEPTYHTLSIFICKMYCNASLESTNYFELKIISVVELVSFSA